MGRSRQFYQWPKNLIKSKPDTILGKPYEYVNQFYTMGKKLGKGNFGETYLCIEKSTGKTYACKSISKRKGLSKSDEKDIKREIEIMQLLSGKSNIVGFKGAYEDDHFVHVVMDLCEGGELADCIRAKGLYNEYEAAKICKQIVEAVHACHSMGVIHRDLKPQNLLFSSNHKHASLKLTDFGVSIFIKKGDYEDRVGTAPYMAPEVIRYRYGKEADIWSVGVILYSLITGRLPFRGVSEQGIYNAILKGDIDFERHPWPTISDGAKDLVLKMLTRDPKKRITSSQVLEHPWITKYGGDKRRSLLMKKLALITIKKLKELVRKVRNKRKTQRGNKTKQTTWPTKT